LLKTVERGSAQLEMQEQELQRAREIQQSLLPKEIPQLPGFQVAGAWLPARTVGGDYYDVMRLGENKIGVCIADVVGKGVSAALLMANVQATVRAFARESESPAWVCDRVNKVLCGNIADGKFVTFFTESSIARRELCSTATRGTAIRFSFRETPCERWISEERCLGCFQPGSMRIQALT
jgi:sigma-B regulation protein RsbU (phosphoserine phosphatase)